MTEKKSFKVKDQKNIRIDKFLTTQLEDFSRSKIQQLIAGDLVLVNDEIIKANYKVENGDMIVVTIPELEVIDIKSEDIPLDIIYEDEDIVIINKAQGMVVHPGAGNPDEAP